MVRMDLNEKTGLILFAHGSRDPQWRLPFEAILRQTQAHHQGPVALAFLECMEPDLAGAIADMASKHVESIRVIPVFLAVGSHVRQDLPRLINQAQEEHPGINIYTTTAIGEQPDIQRAIAMFALSEP